MLSDRIENIWVWNYENHKLFYDLGEKIRFKAVHMNINNSGILLINQLGYNLGDVINLIRDSA